MQPTAPTATQALNSSQTSAAQTSTLLSQVQVATPSISKEGSLSLTLPNGRVVTQHITAQLAQQLNQQLFVIVQNQVAQLFTPQLVSSFVVQLNPALVNALRNWQRTGSDKTFDSLPEGIKTLLLAALPEPKRRFQLFALKLVGQSLQFSGTDQVPALQIQLNSGERNAENKAILSLLQMSIPIALDADESSVWVEQEAPSNQDSATSLSFKMRFDLAKLGVLSLAVSLDDFELKISSQSSTQALFQKNVDIWPKMQQRFEDLGFSVAIQNVLVESKSRISNSPASTKHLLDVKA